ncbi:unnamed protein product [Adineta ricciae]|uniref:Peptidase C39-like domain-containing protein n=1 Tax=Adineta ricciae TaxID=249248 RepID=A0A814S428_ADIRI|nr:unnamed protein product [Adineta ricciae]
MVRLDIPSRLQWDHDNGFCGETAIQSIGLYYGAWLSQKLVRTINQGEYLMQRVSDDDCRDPLRTLSILHFTYDEWDWKNSPEPQFRSFCYWMKKSILHRHPVIFGVCLESSSGFETYDHIVPAVGIRYRNEDEYDPNDELIYYDLFSRDEMKRHMNEEEFGSTTTIMCEKDYAEYGCIPLNINYGIAITGIVDEDRVTLPIQLSVSSYEEPNVDFDEEPIEMIGIVQITDLIVGNVYILLRYSSYEHVPTKGDANIFLQSKFDAKHQFTAHQTTYTYKDAKSIFSTDCVYYRCIQKTD